MKRVRWVLSTVILLSLVLGAAAYAQYPDPWYTTYQVVNMDDEVAADITVDYYDANGVPQTTAQKTFFGVQPGGSVLVVQFTDDPNLEPGTYSAVIQSNTEIAAIANQQLVPAGSPNYSAIPPFSTYSGQSRGAQTITLPAIMYNWYGYYTEVYVMNVGGDDAVDVDISYIPGQMDVGNGPEPTGASGVTDLDNPIALYASLHKSQETMSELGAPSGTFHGRFLGSAIITSDQPIIAVVNQHNPGSYKLMTYNGFTEGATEIAAPSYMRGYYGYYTTLLVANPDPEATAHVQITYTPDISQPYYNQAAPGSTIAPVTVDYEIAPQTALTRYDGPGASDQQSDLDDEPYAYTRFFGSVKITSSDLPVMAQVNVEALATGDDQAGSYNGIPISSATPTVVAPVILADFYGLYTTLIVQNATGIDGSCDVTYTSDGVYSAVKNHSATYTHELPGNGSFTVYEGRSGGAESGDINSDAQWRLGGKKQFLGAAKLSCDVGAVAFVNEEASVQRKDSMYTMNTFNK